MGNQFLRTNNLFIITAVAEFLTGFALIAFPSLTSELLLGFPLTEASGLIVARVAGAALLSIAVACWIARTDEQSAASRGLLTGMLIYNIVASAILAYAGLTLQFTVVLTLVLIFHLSLMSWCIVALKNPKLNKV